MDQVLILIIEDNLAEARLIHEQLNDTGIEWFDLDKTNTLATGIDLLIEKEYSVVLLDLGLPDVVEQFEGIKVIQERISNPPAIIVITNANDDQLASKMVGMGAQDYLVKNELENGNIIKRSILHSIERKKILDELNNFKNNLEQLVLERTQELKTTKDMFEALSEASPVGLFKLDAHGHCEYVNEMWTKITGQFVKDATGKGWTDILYHEDKDSVLAALDDTIRNNIPFDMEFRVVHKITEQPVWVLGKAQHHLFHTGFAGTIVNIHDKKEILHKLLELKNN
jgi:PAS domain S-box-containing protein